MRPLLGLFAALALAACSSSSDDSPAPNRGPDSHTDPGTGTTPPGATPPGTTPPPAKPVDDPGPAPKGCGDVGADGDGFFTRKTSLGSYVGYVPKAYTGKPMRLVVGMHGCGDNAYNFATWAVAPWDTRDQQDWLAISVDDASGSGSCWSVKNDTPKVLAALDDFRSCFYAHQQEIVLQGYSSGGEIAYTIALQNSEKFAGLLIENSGLYATGQGDALIAGATRKIPIAHLAHQNDDVFPVDQVQNDWTKLKAAGFPLQSTVTDGTHEGSSGDWTDWLHPKMETWKVQ
jgi:predicted esterase